jgi:hypothetical protein
MYAVIRPQGSRDNGWNLRELAAVTDTRNAAPFLLHVRKRLGSKLGSAMGNLKLFFVDFFGTSMEISEQYLK